MQDRRDFLGSSDAPGVIGVSDWATPLDVYFEKVDGPSAEREAQNLKAKKRGKRMEPYVVDMAREEFGLQVVARNNVYHDAEHPFLRCEVDFETDDPGETCEVKTVDVRAAKKWGEEGSDEIPLAYAAQAMHSLMVTGRARCRFFALIGFDLVPFLIQRDEEIIAGMRAQELAFWERVKAKRPPPPANIDDVLRLFAKDDGAVIAATDEIRDACAELKALTAGHDKKVSALKERIALHMGGGSVLSYQGDVLATWKEQSGGYHWHAESLERDHPELIADYKKERRFRAMRVK